MDIRNFFGNGKSSLSKKRETAGSHAPPHESTHAAVETKPVKSPDTDTDTSARTISSVQTKQDTAVSDDSPSISASAVSVSDIPSSLAAIITWKKGEPVPYAAVAAAFDKIGNTSSRLEKESILCQLYKAVTVTTPEDLDSVVYLTSNKVFPAYEGLELGIGDALLIKAVVESTGRNRAAVQAAYKNDGDLGTVACQSRSSQSTLGFGAKPKALTARNVLEQLRLITRTTGSKSMDRKVGIIKKMMIACQGNEAKYIVRALQGKLRLGTAAQTVLIGLANAFASPLFTGTGVEEDSPTGVKSMVSEADDDGLVDSDDEDDVIVAKGKRKRSLENITESQENDNESDSAVEKDMVEMLEKVAVRPPPEAVKLSGRLSRDVRNEMAVIAVKRAFSECPSLSVLVDALLHHPLHDLHKHCRLTPGVPVAPMLAKPTKQVAEVLKRLSGQLFTMEYKYDGERAQVHLLSDGTVKIFSRNSEDNSPKYPDLMDVIRNAKREEVVSCVVDAEVVAYDREKGCLLPFQVLSTRKRKVEDGEEDSQKVKVILQAFDLIYLNGKSLLQESFLRRRELLHASFTHSEGFFHFASGSDHMENGDTTPIEVFMQEACGAMCEGLMVKTLSQNATYEPSKRSLNWLKLKKDYIDGMGVCDSVDLVVIGGYHGRGKRTNVYGAYLMACYDPDSDEFQSVCKVGTGFKDEDLQRLTEQMKSHISSTGRKPSNYSVGDPLTPDDWFEPNVVWELQAADLSKSSVHKGGMGKVDSSGRGIGLRFPRYLRDRPDKKPEGATSSDQIVDMYQSQGDMEVVGGEEEDDDDLL
mmetsp:Transcript_12946/g.19482  ORF Transcript_12946/g.19482 Transcript_12946/m.19482 type:complete len:812 (+) Transcript_12946:66-2501(+)